MWGAIKILARLREDVAALLYPPQCLLCFGVEVTGPRDYLCATCMQRVHDEPLPPLRFAHIDQPFDCIPDCDFDFAAWKYSGTMETSNAMEMLIPQTKYHNPRPSLAKFLGVIAAQRMQVALQPHMSANTILLPVPLHAVRKRERGFNQSELIAQAIAAEWGTEAWPRALRRIRYTEQQARLNMLERLQNVKEAFAPGRGFSLEGRSAILVDDVITTGATISACAHVARAMGATSVGAIALARGGG